MKIKKRFKQTCNYFLKYANNNSYPNALKEYNKKHTKELLKFQQGNPDLEKRTDFYDNSTVTNVTIYDILSNDGVSKLSKRLHSLSSKEYRCSVFYNKPTSDGKCRSAFLDLMDIRKFTTEKLSLETGIEKVALDAWFIKEVPSLQHLVLVADSLHTSVDYLLGRTDDFNKPTDEAREVISYYNQLTKLDKHWVVGQMIDLIKKYENEAEQLYPPVAAEGLKKASGK